MMYKIKNKLSPKSPLVISIILLFAGIMVYLLASSFAAKGPATLYTSPGGNQSVGLNGNFEVNVRVSTAGDVPVTGTVATLAYPTDKLQVAAVAYDGSPYNIQLVQTDSGGVLRMERAALPAISGGDQLFAKVTFKAIASGSAAVSFNSDSKVLSGEDDTNLLSARNGVTINITTPTSPTPQPSPSPTPSPTPSPSPSGSSAPSTPPAPGASPPASSSNTSNLTRPPSAGPRQPVQQPTVVIPDTPPPVSTAAEKAPELRILITDLDGKPVKGAKVTLEGKTKETNKQGIAEFNGITDSVQDIAVAYKGKTTNKTIDVSSVLGATDGRAVSLPIDAKGDINILPVVIIPLLLGIVGAFIIFGRKYIPTLHRASMFSHTPGPNTSNVTTGLPVVPQPPQDNMLDQIPYPEAPKPGNTVAPSQNDGSGNQRI